MRPERKESYTPRNRENVLVEDGLSLEFVDHTVAQTKRVIWKEDLMEIGKKRLTLTLVLVAALLAPTVTWAQAASVSHDWSALNSIPSGSKLVVTFKDGRTVEGKLSNVSDVALTLSVKKKLEAIKRDDIQRVEQFKRKSATQATLIGMGIGAGAGAVTGAAGGDNDSFFGPTRGQLAAGLAVVGAGVGAVAGFLVGRSGRKRMVVYESR